MLNTFLSSTPKNILKLFAYKQDQSFSTLAKKQVEVLNFDPSQYSKEQLDYISSVQNLKYSDLIQECKTKRLKPKDRTRMSLLQAIISVLPIHSNSISSDHFEANPPQKGNGREGESNSADKELLSDDINKTLKQILSKEEYLRFQQKQKQIDSRNEDKIGRQFEIDKSVQLQRQVENSEQINSFQQHILKYQEPKEAQTVHFIENYSWEEQKIKINEMNSATAIKEINSLANRSNLIQEYQKSNTQREESELSKEILSQILCIEAEYSDHFRDETKYFLKELGESSIINSSIFHMTKTLADPISFWHCASFFKWGSPSSLISLWKAITFSVDCKIVCNNLKILIEFGLDYDMGNIQILTKCLFMIKKHSRFQTPEEAPFFEKLTTVILSILGDSENTTSIYQLANILGYLKQTNVVYTPATIKNLQQIAEQLSKMYSKHLQNEQINTTKDQPQIPEQLENISADYYMKLLLGISFSHQIPQIIIDHIFKGLIEQGFGQFEKGVIIKILSQLMLSGIPINEDIADSIRKNRKIFVDLNIREIYIFIYSFKDSNQDLGKLYYTFYYQTGILLDNVTTLTGFKQVVMVAKIHHYILTHKINEHKRIFLEKRTNQVFNLINKFCTDQICKEYISDIIYISSLFIPYTNMIDFLFPKIIKNIEFLKINSDNRPLFTNFVMKILDKYQLQYDFFVNTTSLDLEFNDKFNNETRAMLDALIKKFIESKLLSFFLLTVQILAAPNLMKQVFLQANERKEVTRNMTIQIVKVLSHENNKFGLQNLMMICQFFDVNKQYIEDDLILLKAHQMLFLSLQKISEDASVTANQKLIWIYHISNFLKQIPNKISQPAKEKLSEYFIQNVMKPICQDQRGDTNEIVHEDGIIQYFNPNVNSGSVHNISLLPSILYNLDIDLSRQPVLSKFIVPQLNREAKFWEGERLLTNLLCLNNLKIEAFEIFQSCSENLMTTMILYQDTQEFQLNTDIYTSLDKLVSLLEAYSSQYKNHIAKNPSYKNTQPKRFAPLNILACFVFNSLSPSALETIFELIGDQPQVYFKPFVQLVSSSSFNIQDSSLISFNSKIPEFIQNKDLSTKALLKILNSQSSDSDSVTLDHYLKQATKEKFMKGSMVKLLLSRLQHNPSIDYLERLLQYFGMGGIISNLNEIELIMKHYNFNFHQLSEQSHLNMLSIIACWQISHSRNAKLELPAELLLNEQAFYKTVNKFKIEEQEINIPYQESFNLAFEPEVPQYKIFAKSSIKGEQPSEYSFSSQKVDNELIKSVSQSIYPYLKTIIYSQKSFRYSQSFSSRYYLYNLLVKERLNLNEEEKKIDELFKLAQQEQQNLFKQSLSFSNFLLDFSINLNSNLSNEKSYEISYKGQDSGKIIIDIAIKASDPASHEDKIGILFFDSAISNQDIEGSNQFVLPAIAQMKIKMLESTYGWKIFPIYYDEWVKLFNTPESKQKFIQKLISAKEN